jgi:predicted acyltransferase
MFKNPFFKVSLLFGLMAAIAYSIAAFVFIQKAVYTESWILYVGNFAFMTVIACFLFYVSRLKDNNSTTLSLIGAGEKTVIIGMAAAALLSFILLLILVHGLLGTGTPSKVITDKPANTVTDRTNGLDFMLIMNSLIGNFVTGSFVSIMLPASLKRNQKTEKGSPPKKRVTNAIDSKLS